MGLSFFCQPRAGTDQLRRQLFRPGFPARSGSAPRSGSEPTGVSRAKWAANFAARPGPDCSPGLAAAQPCRQRRNPSVRLIPFARSRLVCLFPLFPIGGKKPTAMIHSVALSNGNPFINRRPVLAMDRPPVFLYVDPHRQRAFILFLWPQAPNFEDFLQDFPAES